MFSFLAKPYFYSKQFPDCSTSGFPNAPPFWGGRNYHFAILGGAKYKIFVFGPKAKMKLARYSYGLPRG